MMGRLDRSEPLFYVVKLVELVPPDHLLRRVDRLLNFGPLVEELRPYYASVGRPSIDPELMLRMLLVGYLYGIGSERRLVEEVQLNLAYRWFCGLALDASVPDASTFSKNRHGRFHEADVFRRVFESVVDLCRKAGLADGDALSVDGSFIAADASASAGRRTPGSEPPADWATTPDAQRRCVRAYLEGLDTEAGFSEAEPLAKELAFVPKYLSVTDPQAAWSRVRNIGRFGYKAHFLIDNAHAIIVDAEGTDSRLSNEIVAARRMVERQRTDGHPGPALLAADKSYGTGSFLGWLNRQGIEPMIPVLDRTQQTDGKFGRDQFTFDPERDLFICPAGHELTRRGQDVAGQGARYRASARDCSACALKPQCTNAKARKLERHPDEDVRERVRSLSSTPAFAVAARARRKVEARFAHMKHVTGLEKLRLRGLSGAKEQVLLAAAALNLRSLAKHCPA